MNNGDRIWSISNNFNIISTEGDVNLTASLNSAITASQLTLTSSANFADSIYLHADGGINETIQIRSDQGTGNTSVNIVSDVGGITLDAGDIIILNASNGIVLTSTASFADSIYLHANGGTSETIHIRSNNGTGTASVNIVSDVGGITLDAGSGVIIASTANSVDSIYLHANGGANETIQIRSDQGTDAASINIVSDVGGITLNGGRVLLTSTANSSNSIYLHANGGANETIQIKSDQGTGSSIDIVSNVGGITIDAGGDVTIKSSNNSANSIHLYTNGGISESIQIKSERGTSATSVNIVSNDGGITLNANGAVAVTNNAIIGGPVGVRTTTTSGQSSQTGLWNYALLVSAGNQLGQENSRTHIGLCNSTNPTDDVWRIYYNDVDDGLGGSLPGNLIFEALNNTTSIRSVHIASQAGANGQLNFTGQHRCLPTDESLFNESNIGKIVIAAGTYNNIFTDNNIDINECLPLVLLATLEMDKRCLGVIAEIEDADSTTREFTNGITGITVKRIDRRVAVNSLGEGAMWICNINGNFSNGDYVCSSVVPGYGMRQDDDLLHNYTVAKITMDCTFELDNEIYQCQEIQYDNKIYQVAFVGVTYHCG